MQRSKDQIHGGPRMHDEDAIRVHREMSLRRDFSPPSDVSSEESERAERSAADELTAAAVLISLPSFGNDAASTNSDSATVTPTPTRLNYQFQVPPTAPVASIAPLAAPPTVPSLEHGILPYCASVSDTRPLAHSTTSRSETISGGWFTGTTSLALPQDTEVLSPLHCFMRKYCVEAFSATEADVTTPRYGKSHGGKIVVGQVGIRCLHCKTVTTNRPERAVCYPSSLKNIYHSIETWQRRHALVCPHIPKWVLKEISSLVHSSKTTAGGRRQYWQESAQRLGLVDTNRGVRFARPPGIAMEARPSFAPMTTHAAAAASTLKTRGRPVALPQDKPLVSDHLFLLMDQMQVCQFTEEDRTGGRSKVKDLPLEFPGMECKHCCGRAGFGRYFPAGVDQLSLANSDRNIYNHLAKCRKCPDAVKEELKLSRESKGQTAKRGSRKIFFTRVWERIHDYTHVPTYDNTGSK